MNIRTLAKTFVLVFFNPPPILRSLNSMIHSMHSALDLHTCSDDPGPFYFFRGHCRIWKKKMESHIILGLKWIWINWASALYVLSLSLISFSMHQPPPPPTSKIQTGIVRFAEFSCMWATTMPESSKWRKWSL